MATNLLCWCAVIFLVGPGAAYHCKQNCDSEGLIPEELVTELLPVEQFSHCANPIFCDDSSSGTGHLLYGELTDDMLAVERCYSYCFYSVSWITIQITQTCCCVCLPVHACGSYTPCSRYYPMVWELIQRTSSTTLGIIASCCKTWAECWSCRGQGIWLVIMLSTQLQSFVCFSACLFMRRLDGLKTAPSLYALPANAACKDFCTVEVNFFIMCISGWHCISTVVTR